MSLQLLFFCQITFFLTSLITVDSEKLIDNKATQESAVGCFSNLVEVLLNLAGAHQQSSDSGCCYARESIDTSIRVAALQILRKCASFSELKSDNLPFVNLLGRRLSVCLDDPKRVVRRVAVQARNEWMSK